MTRALKSIVSFAKAVGDLLTHIVHAPKGESEPDPAKEAAKRAQGAMSIGYKGAGGTTATDRFMGKELAAGHKKARKRA